MQGKMFKSDGIYLPGEKVLGLSRQGAGNQYLGLRDIKEADRDRDRLTEEQEALLQCTVLMGRNRQERTVDVVEDLI